MVGDIRPLHRYLLIGGISAFLWIAPISAQADRRVTVLSLLGAVAGFWHCFLISDDVIDSIASQRNKRILKKEIGSYRYGLEELHSKQQLEYQFQRESERAIAAEIVKKALPTQASTQASTQTPPPPEISNRLISLMEWVVDQNGPVTVRQAQRASIKNLRGIKANEIRDLFQQANDLGFGIFENDQFVPIEDDD